MKIAYADPPYLGCCKLYDHEHGEDGRCWDEPETHWLLLERLRDEFPDGWALSCSSPSLPVLLSRHQWDDLRIAAWVKPFAIFKPNVNPAYAWEPVLWRGGRLHRARTEPTVRDWCSANITLRKGLTGAKPEEFVLWLFGLLGVEEHDEVTDIYPGTGVVGLTLQKWRYYKGLFPVVGEAQAPVSDSLVSDAEIQKD